MSSIARQDLAGVETRQQTFRNPTDSEVVVPAAGFGLAGTLTTPPAQGRLRHPAIVLVAGSGPVDRDVTVAGIPLFAQLAGQLAERDFLVLRYDKRGVGKSGGRIERVTLEDYADDAIAVVKWLGKRKDVDTERIFVAGYSEGAAMAMLAAAREKKIAGLVLMAGMGTPGRELILEQQQQLLAQTSLSESERADKVALQSRILEAVIAQKGWEGIPPEMRSAADTTAFRSLVTFDPARAMTSVKQPILILQRRPRHTGPALSRRQAGRARARQEEGGVGRGQAVDRAQSSFRARQNRRPSRNIRRSKPKSSAPTWPRRSPHGSPPSRADGDKEIVCSWEPGVRVHKVT